MKFWYLVVILTLFIGTLVFLAMCASIGSSTTYYPDDYNSPPFEIQTNYLVLAIISYGLSFIGSFFIVVLNWEE